MSVFRKRKTAAGSGFIEPCLPSHTAKPPAAGESIHEIKLDGFRLLAHRHGSSVCLLTRHATDWTTRFPLVADAITRLACRSCVIDGEVVAPDENGLPSFELLRRRQPAVLYAFDLLQLDGADLRREPIELRKAMLAKLLAPQQSGIRFNDHIEGSAREIFDQACKLGYEGIVCKRAGSLYRSGRSTDWVKLKNPDSAAVRRERKGTLWQSSSRERNRS
jgi:bifunctional non-homologous end joining protein LigD